MPVEYLSKDNLFRLPFLAVALAPRGLWRNNIEMYFQWYPLSASAVEFKSFEKVLRSSFLKNLEYGYWCDFLKPGLFLECCQTVKDEELKILRNFYLKTLVGAHNTEQLDHYYQWLCQIRDHLNGVPLDAERFKNHYRESRFCQERYSVYFQEWVSNVNYHWLLLGLSASTIQDFWVEFVGQHKMYERFKNIDAYRAFFESADGLISHRVCDWFRLNVDVMNEGITPELLEQFSEDSPYYYTAHAMHLTSLGRHEEALQMMETELKFVGARRLFEGSFENFIYGICLFNNRANPKIYKRMDGFANRNAKGIGQEIVRFISHLATDRELRTYKDGEITADANFSFIYALTYQYFASDQDEANELADILNKNGTPFWKYLFLGSAKEKDLLNRFDDNASFPDLWPIYRVMPEWERALDRVLKSKMLADTPKSATQTIKQERVIYWVNLEKLSVQPRLIKSQDGVRWSKGRDISLSTFKEGGYSEFITDQDRRVAKTLRMWGWSYPQWSLSGPETLYELIGCPYVYRMDQPEQEVRIEEELLQLEVTKTRNGWKVLTNIPEDQPIQSGCYCLGVESNLIKILKVTDEQSELLLNLRSIGEFPAEAKSKLTQVVERISSHMMVMGDLVANATQLNKVKGKTEITFQFSPIDNDAYKVQATVCPLPESTLTCQPGKGLEHIATQLNGQGVQVKRNLAKEKANFEALADVLHPFDEAKEQDYLWQVDTLRCLNFLEALRDCKDVKIVWPEGVRMKVSYPSVSAGNVHLSLNRIDQWFELAGHVSIDGKTEMAIADLLKKVREAKGNFIPLDNNEYLAITDNLRKHLTALDHVVQSSKKTSTLSMYNTGFVEELEKDGAVIEADGAWKELSQRIAEAENFQPQVPSNLTAQLRDYQVDGFEWMSRLAKWGAGACLSDDMGLGKTLQMIAMLLSRVSDGPALVVVPTSLVFNWSSELNRFAPSLNVRKVKATDRADLIESAVAGDVVLVTYGVLSSEIDLFKQKSWATVVLDEAHVIKNRETKMAKACCSLKGDFKVILTGTPIQNNLSEIWSLFEFINPGLLGSFKQFTDRFILPIERDQDKERQRLLKRILSPFILRRTKSEVLDELPQKTEVTIKVTLSDKERALYEHLRLETTTSLDLGEISPIQALAALMKLRQAACHPKLVDPKLNLTSSKCERFLSLVEELKDNNHRALVFSQFTSHLDLIKQELDKRGVEYLYLDGSMSSMERLRLVDAFQKGNQLLFLISLKAGGTGLNLTAADYVIHLDPWWNPAIENQASDRAYRIGQERPVTIYRLIAENTVEERILDLHKTKKSLADALMEGGDMANQLSKEEILKLLSQL